MKVTINRWNAVSTWHWGDTRDEVCGICRVAFEGTCPGCKYPGDDCPLMIGECSHAFHMHCLLNWLSTEASRGLCPMCRRRFQTAKAVE
ncbi:anaphase-promoting complex subunit 11 [Lipomyces oligophaga]|uniref:anaphase-promoting complex subunit 11 n=1 Tax=Lipomyces oligophaga TaxID=45792 RepID=UPI0034CFB99C